MIKILHISPFHFSADSVIGGGERYAHCLAKELSKSEDVRFLTFANTPEVVMDGDMQVIRLKNLWCLEFFCQLFWADVIHCHQLRYPHTDLALIFGKLFGKKVFATDLGGGCARALSDHIPILRLASGYLLLSEYSRKLLLEKDPKLAERSRIIYGGVDLKKFHPDDSRKKSGRVLYVGRIVSHKGIEYLIDAVSGDVALDIVGPSYEPDYMEMLKIRARGKQVTFLGSISDAELVIKLQEALVVVQPSVHKIWSGQYTAVPELLGLASLEAMACGTPAIVTTAGSLPEIVKDGETGFIVPQNDANSIREKIDFLRLNPAAAEKMGKSAVKWVMERFSWESVAEAANSIYRESLNK